ncbi:hypothetical protein SNOG_20049 [Parastagonospora nodorum SN15]|uniref:Uncharacterized protein n=1 Tax=Phaeosphaeria nodorum (strain SN15 / ATCC MYA-4574 / FGSC 10173) TaxID=321614 RepID=A9JX49_PHANO|nr:hypothetical protein SNOG_20049 [Parastagonospora nodorum SN15]EDP89905.1 hypothetical protein SNOG_20049 [Parastagonospora nodorum SN15]
MKVWKHCGLLRQGLSRRIWRLQFQPGTVFNIVFILEVCHLFQNIEHVHYKQTLVVELQLHHYHDREQRFHRHSIFRPNLVFHFGIIFHSDLVFDLVFYPHPICLPYLRTGGSLYRSKWSPIQS